MNSSLVYKHNQRMSNCNSFLHFIMDALWIQQRLPCCPRRVLRLQLLLCPHPAPNEASVSPSAEGGKGDGGGFPPD